MVKFKYFYIVQRTGKDGSFSYIATSPVIPDIGVVSDTPESAISALRSALVNLLRDIKNDGSERELHASLENDEIVGFGVMEAVLDDRLPVEEETKGSHSVYSIRSTPAYIRKALTALDSANPDDRKGPLLI